MVIFILSTVAFSESSQRLGIAYINLIRSKEEGGKRSEEVDLTDSFDNNKQIIS